MIIGVIIFDDVSVLFFVFLFWCSFIYFIGGMGVLVFVFVIMENFKNSYLEVMRVEVFGFVFGKVVLKFKKIV